MLDCEAVKVNAMESTVENPNPGLGIYLALQYRKGNSWYVLWIPHIYWSFWPASVDERVW